MTSKERVMKTMAHEEPDRIPLDLGGCNNTCMHNLVEQRVKQALGLADHGLNIKCRLQGVVLPDPSVVDYFGVDTCSIYINEVRPWVDNGDGTFHDMWGITTKLNPDGYYYNRIGHPLEHIESVEDIEKFEIPEPNAYMLEGLSERLNANADKCCILEGMWEQMFGLPSWLRGNTNFYMDLMEDDGLSDALLSKLLAYYKKLVSFVLDAIGDRIDIVKVADDLGTQNIERHWTSSFRRGCSREKAVSAMAGSSI